METKVTNIEAVINSLKREKDIALQSLNKVREEVNFGEDLLKLRGDKIHLLNEITDLRLEVEGLEKAKKADFLLSIRGELSEFEATKRNLSLEVNELISAIASFKAEKILLNKTLDEISQQIIKDKNVADDAIKIALQEIGEQETRIIERVFKVNKREVKVKLAEKELYRNKSKVSADEIAFDTAFGLFETDKRKLKEGSDADRAKIKNGYVVLEAKIKAYKEKTVKKEMEFSVWEDNLKRKGQEFADKFKEVDLTLEDIEKAKVKIKKETEDLNLSWKEYKRQSNLLKKRYK